MYDSIMAIFAFWVCGMVTNAVLLPATAIFAAEFFTEIGYVQMLIWIIFWPILLPAGIIKFIVRHVLSFILRLTGR